MLKFFRKKKAAKAPQSVTHEAETGHREVAEITTDDVGAAATRQHDAIPESLVADLLPQASPTANDMSRDADAGVAAAEAGPQVPAAGEPQPSSDGGERRGWRARLSGSALARGVGGLFDRNPRLDDSLLDELETVLITADVGIQTTTEVCEALRGRMHKREFADVAALRRALRGMLMARLEAVQQPLDISDAQPFVLMVVGVNGAGKTTTIGKLARHAQAEGLSVMLAAGDTFRAAAVEQLQAWGQRNGVPVVSQGQGADAASVVFDAVQAARARRFDLLIADTAGRLHTQANLMDELGKIARVIKKLDAEAPHEVLMVIDGSTGQNAIAQVRQFRECVDVTGLVVTKLDGTAKGGVVFALASEFGLPIRFVGMGEDIDDLRVFEAERYVDGLVPGAL